MKRNVTITLDDATARWARIEAARRDTSLSEFLASVLRQEMQEEETYQHAMEDYLSREPVVLKRKGRYPERSTVHERTRFR
jgi:hypothetical protein